MLIRALKKGKVFFVFFYSLAAKTQITLRQILLDIQLLNNIYMISLLSS